MKIKYFFMISLLAIISFSTLTSNTFAGDDTPDSEVEKITVAPGVTVKKLPDGSESRSMTIPGYPDYSRSTITKDGKITGSSVSMKQPDGTTVVEVTDKNGKTSTATIEVDGSYAVGSSPDATAYLSNVAAGTTQNDTITSEMVPGGNCICIAKGPGGCDVVANRLYKCTTGTGVSGFEELFKNIVNYIVKIVLLLAVLAVAGIGIAWTFAGGDDIKLKTTIKGWAMNVVAGIIILFLFGLILSFLAPWVYQF